MPLRWTDRLQNSLIVMHDKEILAGRKCFGTQVPFSLTFGEKSTVISVQSLMSCTRVSPMRHIKKVAWIQRFSSGLILLSDICTFVNNDRTCMSLNIIVRIQNEWQQVLPEVLTFPQGTRNQHMWVLLSRVHSYCDFQIVTKTWGTKSHPGPEWCTHKNWQCFPLE